MDKYQDSSVQPASIAEDDITPRGSLPPSEPASSRLSSVTLQDEIHEETTDYVQEESVRNFRVCFLLRV